MGRSVRTSRPSTGWSTCPALSPRRGTPPSPSGLPYTASRASRSHHPGAPLNRDFSEPDSSRNGPTQRRVKVLFGSDDLVGRLLELADSVRVNHPPTADHIWNEVAAVTNGLVAPARDGGGQEAVQEFIARQVVIQHVDTVNIHVTSAHAGGRGPQKLPAA